MITQQYETSCHIASGQNSDTAIRLSDPDFLNENKYFGDQTTFSRCDLDL